jgi:hypothetical protein
MSVISVGVKRTDTTSESFSVLATALGRTRRMVDVIQLHRPRECAAINRCAAAFAQSVCTVSAMDWRGLLGPAGGVAESPGERVGGRVHTGSPPVLLVARPAATVAVLSLATATRSHHRGHLLPCVGPGSYDRGMASTSDLGYSWGFPGRWEGWNV